jgi:hypothetical protein
VQVQEQPTQAAWKERRKLWGVEARDAQFSGLRTDPQLSRRDSTPELLTAGWTGEPWGFCISPQKGSIWLKCLLVLYPFVGRHTRNQATLIIGGAAGRREGIAWPLRAASNLDVR